MTINTKYKDNKRIIKILRFRATKYLRKRLAKNKNYPFYAGTWTHRTDYKQYKKTLKQNRLIFYDMKPIQNEKIVLKKGAKKDLDEGKKNHKKENTFGREGLSKNKDILLRKQRVEIINKDIMQGNLKKYSTKSYLYQIISQLPRKYTFQIFNQNFYRQTYKMSMKIPKARFTMNKIVTGYYKNLSYKTLKKIARKSSLLKTQPFIWTKKQPIYSPEYYEKKQQFYTNIDARYDISTKQTALNFIQNIEQRLDSTLIRLFNFKARITNKKRSRYDNSGRKRWYPFKKRSYMMKSPFTTYTPLQIKQLIMHGHVYVNKRKVTYGNYLVQIGDKISLKGNYYPMPCNTFFDNSIISSNQRNNNSSFINFLLENHQQTILLRRLKDKEYIKNLSTHTSLSSHSPLFSDSSSSQQHLFSFIQNLRLKRFTEIFFLTYRNLHLIDHSFKHSRTISVDSLTHIEKHIKPIFEYLGHNQSIFLLWPLLSLLKISSFHSDSYLKKNILKFGTLHRKKAHAMNKNMFQDLLAYKRSFQKMENIIKKQEKSQDNVYSINKKSIPAKIINLQRLYDKQTLSKHKPFRRYNATNSLFHLRSSTCYASLLYGSRKTFLVRFQQNARGNFHNRLYNKFYFFNLELQFFQNLIKYYTL